MQTEIILAVLASFGVATATARAGDDSFVGKWKLNPEKSQVSGLTYKVEEAGNNQYKFIFGDNSETVTFGKEHLTKYGNTWLITKSGPNAWKWTTRRNGKVIADATWTFSEDGATSTYVSTETRPDGSTSRLENKLKRTAGTSGLVGTWESTELKIGSPTTMGIAKWQSDGYSLTDSTYKERIDFKLDGKEYADKGPRVANGTTVSGKQIDDHHIELTYKLKGKTTETDRWELSTDGQTLTDTVMFSGQSKPEVDVFDRQ